MLQLFPAPPPVGGRGGFPCPGRGLRLVGQPKVTFYSGPDCASIATVIQPGEQNETFAYDWPWACSRILCGTGQCRGPDGDTEEYQGNRRDHPRLPRLVDSVFLSGRQPEADRLCDGHLLQDRRRREEGAQARQA